ncbi:MAG: glycosyltransferase, partial [Bdellovibrionales bacterium]|nr:glycosyltransferase [Bdellovibrionales bacterium]
RVSKRLFPPSRNFLFFVVILHSETTPISLAIITFDEGDNVMALFRQLFSEKQDSRPFEVIAVHNGGSNFTLECLDQARALSPVPFTIIQAPQNSLGHSRKLAIEAAKSPLVAFVDGDCQVPEGWLSQLREQLHHCLGQDPKTAGVGGPNRADPSSTFGQTLNLALASPLGHGGTAQGHWVDQLTKTDHLPTTNALFRRDKVLAVGNFDSSFSRTCEDVDLGVRLNRAGFSLFMGPGPVVVNRCAEGWREWLERMKRFGYSQARWVSLKRSGLHGPSVLSAFGIQGFLCLPLLGLAWPKLLGLYAAYGGLLIIESWRLYKLHRQLNQLFPVVGVLAITHFAYGWGSLRGYLDLLLGLNKVQAAKISQTG